MIRLRNILIISMLGLGLVAAGGYSIVTKLPSSQPASVLGITKSPLQYTEIFVASGSGSKQTQQFSLNDDPVRIEFSIRDNRLYGIEGFITVILTNVREPLLKNVYLVGIERQNYDYADEFTGLSGEWYLDIKAYGKWQARVYQIDNELHV